MGFRERPDGAATSTVGAQASRGEAQASPGVVVARCFVDDKTHRPAGQWERR